MTVLTFTRSVNKDKEWRNSLIERLKESGQQRKYLQAENYHCIAMLCRFAVNMGWKTGLKLDEKADNSVSRNLVIIDTPSGQISWHIHEQYLHLFNFLDVYQGFWEGEDCEKRQEIMYRFIRRESLFC